MSDSQPRLLLIDDDVDTHRMLTHLLSRRGYAVTCVTNFTDACQQMAAHTCDAILLDWCLEAEDGLDLIEPLRKQFGESPIILITAHSSVEVALRAIQVGAFDYVPKPVDEGRLILSVTKAVEYGRLRQTLVALHTEPHTSDSFEGMIGTSRPMRLVYSVIEQAAPTDSSVMICGASGTGKELVARALHRRSPRERGPFVALNMAALPKELVESTLFGHERGAFTGAERQRIGAVEEAAGGTLFLDELAEMPIELQPKLLRFIQDRKFRRVGGERDLESDVRIVSATNRDPMIEMNGGRLRPDLFYRLNVIPVQLPPLSQRREDIPLLAQAALKQFSEQHHRHFKLIEDGAMARLTAHAWPGNVRQLFHTIERVVVLNDGMTLTDVMLEPYLEPTTNANMTRLPRPQPDHNRRHDDPLTPTATADYLQNDEPHESDILPMAELERQAIQQAIIACDGSAARAARKLGISEATIYRKLKIYGRPGERKAG